MVRHGIALVEIELVLCKTIAPKNYIIYFCRHHPVRLMSSNFCISNICSSESNGSIVTSRSAYIGRSHLNALF